MFTYEHPRGDYWTLADRDFGSLFSSININGGIILNPVNSGITYLLLSTHSEEWPLSMLF